MRSNDDRDESDQCAGGGVAASVPRLRRTTVYDVMTRTVFSVLPDTDLHEVAQVLFANAVRAVPVVDGVEGVVAVVDELSYLVDEMVAESRIGPLY